MSTPTAASMPALPGEVAGLGRRFGAVAIDWVVSTGVALLIVGSAGYLSNDASLMTLLVFAVEVALLTWLTSASFGQRILGMRVVRTNGTRLGLLRSVGRTLLVCLVIPAVVIDQQGRGLHDRAVGSVAILAPRAG